LAIRSSIDAFRPSLDTFNELSKSGRFGSKCAPRHARSVMKSRTSCDACLLITCRAPVSNSGSRPLWFTCSRVTASVYTELIVTNSGTFTNSPTRVTGRSLLPVAFISTVVVVPVNTAPHASIPATPAASRRSGRR